MQDLVGVLKKTNNIFTNKRLIHLIKQYHPSIKKVLLQSLLNDIPTACLSESVQFFNAIIFNIPDKDTVLLSESEIDGELLETALKRSVRDVQTGLNNCEKHLLDINKMKLKQNHGLLAMK